MKVGDKFRWKNPNTGKVVIATIKSSMKVSRNCRIITTPDHEFDFPVPEDDLIPETVFKSPLYKALSEVDKIDREC